jgi:hypothetical protein
MFSRGFTTYYIPDLMARKAVPRLVHGTLGWRLNDRKMAALLLRAVGFLPTFFSSAYPTRSASRVAYNLELSIRVSF